MSMKRNPADHPLELTATVEEGPYYKTGSPEHSPIAEKGTPGKKLVLEGRVLDIRGRPIAHAWLDFWQANGNGEYDNEGYNLRGHQYTDENGRYRLETVRPREYSFRSPHIHAKVRANENSPVLTVQLFFPDEERNRTDPIFEKKTLMNVAEMKDSETATFDFVVEVK